MAELIYSGDTTTGGAVGIGTSTTVRYATIISPDADIKLQRVDLYLGYRSALNTLTLYLFSDAGDTPGSIIKTLATKNITATDPVDWYTI